MIGKLVRHIEFDAIGIVVDHFVWGACAFAALVGSDEGYKVKFLKPVPPTGEVVNPVEEIMSAASSFEEVTNESR